MTDGLEPQLAPTYIWTCMRCGKKTHQPNQDPPADGWYVEFERVFHRKRYMKAKVYYCSKDCFVNGIQYHNYRETYLSGHPNYKG